MAFEALVEVLVYHQVISIERCIEEMGYHILIRVFGDEVGWDELKNIQAVNDRMKMLMGHYYHGKLHWYWKEFCKNQRKNVINNKKCKEVTNEKTKDLNIAKTHLKN